MDPVMIALLLAVSVLAGLLGALFGIGGGIIFIPVLTIGFGLSATEAAAVSLVGIVATSAGSGAYYAEKKVANVRLGLLLEVGTTLGAIVGAFVAVMIEDWILMVVFSVFLLINAYRMVRSRGRDCGSAEGEHEFWFTDMKSGEQIGYDVSHKVGGTIACIAAGAYSSMTGVGGGVIKVPIMNAYMGVPLKAATATSSYMIGITAFSGAIIYLLSGQILLEYAAYVAIGAYIGMFAGTHISKYFDTASLKKYFAIVLVASAVSMLLEAGGVL